RPMPKAGSGGASSPELALDLVQPVRVCLQQATAEVLLEQEIAGSVRQARGAGDVRVEDRGHLLYVPPQPLEAFEDLPVLDHVAGEQAKAGLVLQLRETRRRAQPFAQRLAAARGQAVDGPAARLAGVLLARDPAERQQPLR